MHCRCILCLHMLHLSISSLSILHPDMIHVDAVRSSVLNFPVMLLVMSISSYCVFVELASGCFPEGVFYQFARCCPHCVLCSLTH